MPHTRTTIKTVYQFNELSDDAKDKARTWFREASAGDDFHGYIFDDAKECGAILGIDIAARNQKCILTGKNGREWIDASQAIYYSGFCSQGDGACFEGSYAWKNCSKTIRDHAPQDAELHRIADTLTTLPNGEGWCASMKHRGHYYHSGCMSVDVNFNDEWYRLSRDDDDAELPQADFTAGEETIIQAMRDFADWIYSQLEKEWDWRNADEQVDESIIANEYEFTEEGEIA